MLSQPASPTQTTTAMHGGLPLTTGNLTEHESSALADEAGYARLLQKFPQSLHDDIRQSLPALAQLTSFHQELEDHGLQLTEKSVAYALHAHRDHRVADEARSRIQYLTDFQQDHHVVSRDVYGATLLHHAILEEDLGLARALLAKSNVDSGAIIQPRMRVKDWTRIAYAVNSLPPSSGPDATHQAILGALKRREHPGGRSGYAFAGHNGDNPLIFALTRDASPAMIELLVEHYAAQSPAMLSAVDANGVPPLMAAVGSGREAAVRLLLKQPAVNIHGTNAQGQNAVMAAIVCGNRQMLDLLISYSPDLDMRDAQGRTAQDLAIACGACDLYTRLVQARLLAASNSDDKHRISQQIIRDFRAAAVAGNLPMVKTILNRFGASLDTGLIASVLGDAVRTPGSAKVVDCLMDSEQTGFALSAVAHAGLELAAADADIFDTVASAIYPENPADVMPDKRQALMHRAASLGVTHWVTYALDGGTDIDHYDAGHLSGDGSSVLIKSLAQENDYLTTVLLSRGPALLDPDGGFDNSALAVAGMQAKTQARAIKNLALIVTHHPNLYGHPDIAINLTRIAIARDLPDLIDRLVADGQLQPQAFDDDERSLLMQVMEKGSVPLLASLLQAGAPVADLLDAPNGNVDAALAYAADHPQTGTFDLLLNACQLSPADDADQSLRRLALAAKAGSVSACKSLMDQAAIVLPITATRRMNPLLQAVIGGHHAVLSYLLMRGGHGCLRYKTIYKSAIEKALTMQDGTAVAIVLAHDRHLAAELPPVMNLLMDIAITNRDVLSFEHLTKAMMKYETSAKKYQQCVANAIDIGCTAAVKLILDPRVLKTLPEHEREALFRRALCVETPNVGIVTHFLKVEGHPRAGDGGIDHYTSTLNTGSSGASRLVNALFAEDAPHHQKLFWMATILCETYLDASFSANRDMTIQHWGRLVAPLAKSMKGDGSFSAALGMAAAMAVQSGKPRAFCDILFNIASRVLDVNIDLMPAAESILATKRLDLLDLLPEDVQYRLQARYKSQVGAPYSH